MAYTPQKQSAINATAENIANGLKLNAFLSNLQSQAMADSAIAPGGGDGSTSPGQQGAPPPQEKPYENLMMSLANKQSGWQPLDPAGGLAGLSPAGLLALLAKQGNNIDPGFNIPQPRQQQTPDPNQAPANSGLLSLMGMFS